MLHIAHVIKNRQHVYIALASNREAAEVWSVWTQGKLHRGLSSSSTVFICRMVARTVLEPPPTSKAAPAATVPNAEHLGQVGKEQWEAAVTRYSNTQLSFQTASLHAEPGSCLLNIHPYAEIMSHSPKPQLPPLFSPSSPTPPPLPSGSGNSLVQHLPSVIYTISSLVNYKHNWRASRTAGSRSALAKTRDRGRNWMGTRWALPSPGAPTPLLQAL